MYHVCMHVYVFMHSIINITLMVGVVSLIELLDQLYGILYFYCASASTSFVLKKKVREFSLFLYPFSPLIYLFLLCLLIIVIHFALSLSPFVFTVDRRKTQATII